MIDTEQPAGASAVPQSDPDPWVTLAEASRIVHRHVNAVKSIALAGGIRTRVIPGARILYHRGDALALAAGGS
jgi:hypothetical protein